MRLYLRVLSYLKPYWKQLVLSFLATMVFLIASYSSYWLSVSFIKEIFMPTTPQSQEAVALQDSTQLPQIPAVLDVKQMEKKAVETINHFFENLIVTGNHDETMIRLCLIIFASFFIKNLAAYIRHVLLAFIQVHIVVHLRDQLHSRLLRLPLSFFHKWHSGQLTSIVFNDVSALQAVLKDNFVILINNPIQIIFNLCLLYLISPKLTLYTLLLLPVSGFLIYQIGQSIRRKSRRVLKQVSVVYAKFQETVQSVRIIKAFTSEEKEESQFVAANRDFFKKQFKTRRLNYLTSPLNETLGVGLFAFLLWFGSQMVYSDALPADYFLKFLIMIFALFQPLRELSKLNNVIQTGMAASERIFNLMDSSPEVYSKKTDSRLPAFREKIEFRDVSFSYEKNVPVLRNIDMIINAGEMVAFVGQSGAGKTTLVDLIPRFYEIEQGDILIDEHNIRDVGLTSLRDQIGIVTQESILFTDTIRNNIAYGLDAVDDEAVIRAAKAANAWEFIEKMEDGLDTIVGERGENLSGGQRQRLSIARAIMKNTPIMILDEATSSLDTESERLVQEAIDHLMENRTVLVIAHRLSTVIHADKIIVLEKGKIVGEGKHADLLKSCPVYKNLYEMQFRDEKKS